MLAAVPRGFLRVLIGVSLFGVPVAGAEPRDASLTIFAAASLTDVMTSIIATFRPSGCTAPRVNFAGSQILARQIERGAPADVVITADEAWMDHLEQGGLIRAETRRNAFTNSLAVVAPKESAPAVFTPGDLPNLVGDGRLALANTRSVPAGRYARAALEALGLWPQLSGTIVESDNVRTALAFAARGEVPAAIVYGTDAAAEPRVRTLATIPGHLHPPIRYPVAIVAGASPCADGFLDHLGIPATLATLRDAGFMVIDPDG